MTEIRNNYTFGQPLTGGYSSVRVNFNFVQPATGGYPSVRENLTFAQPAIGGYSVVRVNYLFVQVLFPVAPEGHVSTIPFPGFGNSVLDPTIPAAKDPFNNGLPGLAFSVHKRPQFATRISEASSGYEIRNALMDYPRWEFELTYEFLEDSSGADSSLKKIMGFFLARQGSFDSWLFKDPDDYLVTAGSLGTGDAVTTEFFLVREIGEFAERVGQVDTANDINVYNNGVLVDPADYTIQLPNSIVFDAAPANGHAITADFQFFFACRFNDDAMDFEKFGDKLWNLNECNFRSIIQ